MIEHLNIKGKLDLKEVSVFLVLKPNLNPPLGTFEVKNRQKQIRNEKVKAPQSKRGKNYKKDKPLNTTKPSSQTLKKFLICHFVAIKVQR